MNPSLPPLLAKIDAIISRPPSSPIPGLNIDPEDVHCTEDVDFPFMATPEKYTGISFEAIPPVPVLNEEEWQLLADAFKQLFKTLDIHILDLPDNYPEDEFIELIRNHWDVEMTYYKWVGTYLSCCTDDNETCPYGEECQYCGPNAVKYEGIFKPGTGGFFRDDGTPIDLMTVHIPDLCLDCVSFLKEDEEENILCTLTRMDYDGTGEFVCYAYRKIRKKH